MDGQLERKEAHAGSAVSRSIAAGCPWPAQQVRTDLPERLPVLSDESNLILQFLGTALSDIFAP
jgi:hypothetical protein